MHRGFSLLITVVFFLLAGCASQVRYTRPSGDVASVKRPSGNAAETKVVKSPTTKGVYQTGMASWYGPGFNGKKTASGERFNMNNLTAAHKKLPFNTMIKVVNLDNRKSVVVRINDRGPFTKNRIIDLSKAAAVQLDMLKTGTAKVSLEVVDK